MIFAFPERVAAMKVAHAAQITEDRAWFPVRADARGVELAQHTPNRDRLAYQRGPQYEFLVGGDPEIKVVATDLGHQRRSEERCLMRNNLLAGQEFAQAERYRAAHPIEPDETIHPEAPQFGHRSLAG